MHGVGMVVSGGGIILMMVVMSEPFSYLYYAGLILVIIFASNLAGNTSTGNLTDSVTVISISTSNGMLVTVVVSLLSFHNFPFAQKTMN